MTNFTHIRRTCNVGEYEPSRGSKGKQHTRGARIFSSREFMSIQMFRNESCVTGAAAAGIAFDTMWFTGLGQKGGDRHMLVDREKPGAQERQQSTRWRVPVCLARHPDVPSTGCDGRASGQGRTTLRLLLHKTIAFSFLPHITEEKMVRGMLPNEWGHWQIRVQVIHHTAQYPCRKVRKEASSDVATFRSSFLASFYFPLYPENQLRKQKEEEELF